MTELGAAFFTESPVYGTFPILDGVQFGSMVQPLRKVPSGGAHVLQHASGDVTLQLDYRGAEAPDGDSHYSWPIELLAREEAIWWLVERLWKSRQSVYWITWGQEEEVFTAGMSLSAWVLPRPTAASVISHPDLSSYQTRAWVDDVEKEVITSGTPTSGQVKVAGRDVVTSTLVAGQVVRVRYVPAYSVAMTECGPEVWNQFNELSRSFTLTEVRSSL